MLKSKNLNLKREKKEMINLNKKNQKFFTYDEK